MDKIASLWTYSQSVGVTPAKTGIQTSLATSLDSRLRRGDTNWRQYIYLTSKEKVSEQPRRQGKPDKEADVFPEYIGHLAIQSLYDELELAPKPGLVSFEDHGSHQDMTADTFIKSLFVLRPYFSEITHMGMRHAPFADLKKLAIQAEKRMLNATSGVNTHKGAIFCLGMICAAVGYHVTYNPDLTPESLSSALLEMWGKELATHAEGTSQTHGHEVYRKYGIKGAREEAALGFPSVFNIGYPALLQHLAQGHKPAMIHAFFTLMSRVQDTNIFHRGGVDAAQYVQRSSSTFLAQGSILNPEWEANARALHQEFITRNLSPGGAADLLAASVFLYKLACEKVER